MSNYNWQELPDELADLKGMIVIGGEVINGTGTVEARFYQDEKDHNGVFLCLDIEQAEAVAKMLWTAASDSRWSMFSSNMDDPWTPGRPLGKDPKPTKKPTS